ncbi:hypothetical protein BHM03_00002088 [Ensete ventricosum]|nr:hypothetical protein BHM03_00002088 [Ensete ventricosum]
MSLSFSRLVKDEPQIDSDGQLHDQFAAFFFFIFLPITISLLVALLHRWMDRARRHADLMHLPVTIYVSDDRHRPTVANARSSCSKETASCRICLDELMGGQAVRVMPQCGHVYHRACIDEWLAARSDFCPLCRRRVIGGGADEINEDRRSRVSSSGGGGGGGNSLVVRLARLTSAGLLINS